MDFSPLNKVLPSWDAPTLQGFDLDSLQDGQRLKGSARQFVRFYKKTFVEVYATEVDINPATGTSVVKKTGTREVEREMVNIITPGDKNEIDDVACDYHKREHWAAYKAFRDGKTAPMGINLDECSFVSPHIATELRYYGCHTLEQLADCSDILAQQIANGFELREFARAKVDAENRGKSDGRVNLLKSELEKSQAVIAEMQKQIGEMKGMLLDSRGQQINLEDKPKRGRPRKIEDTSTVNTGE
jgi:hypothetical protein